MIEGRNRRTRATSGVARQFGAMIERLARGYEADPDLRRDLVQEIHAALWRSFAIFEGQCSEKSWTYRIAHNVAVTHLVSAKRRRRRWRWSGSTISRNCRGRAIPKARSAGTSARTGCSRRSTACSRPTGR